MELIGALTGMKASIELVALALDARDDRKAKEAIGTLSARLTDMNMEALRMSEILSNMRAKLSDTEELLRAAQSRERQRESYVLHQIGEGSVVYAFKPREGDPTPPHYKCQICLDRGESSILSPSMNGNFWQCRIEPQHSVRASTDPPYDFSKPDVGPR